MSRITYQKISKVTARCIRQMEQLGQLDGHHPLVNIPIFTATGQRIILDKFWPDETEATHDEAIDSMRMWVNFYTTLLLASLKAKKQTP